MHAMAVTAASQAGPRYERSFNRFELKYVIPFEEALGFVTGLGELLQPDPHAGPGGVYRLGSTYYDSDGFACFWEKLDGLKVRRKLRVRRYEDIDDGTGFIEIKQRVDRTVQKRRIRLPLDTIFSILPPPSGEERAQPGELLDDPVVAEALALVSLYDLRPKINIRYQRRAYFATYDPALRITIDTRLTCRTHNLDWTGDSDGEIFFMPPHMAVMEIKFNHSVPIWLTTWVAHFEAELRRLSKYCAGVNLAYFHGEIL